MIPDQNEIAKAKKRTDLFYLLFGLVAPALLVVLNYLIAANIETRPTVTEQAERFLYMLFFLSIIQTGQALVTRWKLPGFFIKSFFKKRMKFNGSPEYPDFVSVAQGLTIKMFVFLEACTFYGLSMVFFGFEPGYIWIFVPFTVIGCLIVRPNEEFLRRLYDIYQERRVVSTE